MNLLEHLNWRYATKKMTGEKISKEKLDYILEAVRIAPTSSGLQPFEVFVISNKELLEKIKPVAFNQSQITDASELLVFASWDNYSDERMTAAFNHMNAERGLPLNTTDDYKNNILSLYMARDPEINFAHTARQSYIAMAFALAAAAEQKIDATPIEGFNPDGLDQLLNLREKGLRSTVLVALGHRDNTNDWLVKMKKVRKNKESLFTFID